jgi:hypothetical protein
MIVIGPGAVGKANTGLFFPANLTPVTSGVPVLFDTTTGQMGPTTSAERYKENVRSIGIETVHALGQLRPVSYHYRADPSRKAHFGFVAEEVAGVVPHAVCRNAENEIVGVNPLELIAPLLLQARLHESRLYALEQAIA